MIALNDFAQHPIFYLGWLNNDGAHLALPIFNCFVEWTGSAFSQVSTKPQQTA